MEIQNITSQQLLQIANESALLNWQEDDDKIFYRERKKEIIIYKKPHEFFDKSNWYISVQYQQYYGDYYGGSSPCTSREDILSTIQYAVKALKISERQKTIFDFIGGNL